MTGDISKNQHVPAKDFSLVRMQQGRLFSDADWNEQGDILRTSDRETGQDVIGHAGFPEGNAGFALIPDAATDSLMISAGKGYVAGVGHVVRAPAMFGLTRVSGSGSNTVWRIDEGAELADGDVLSTDPAGLTGFVKVRNSAESAQGVRTFRTLPALGNAASMTAFRPVAYASQPYGGGAELPDQAGDYLAVLKSTDLAVTALDDPALREVAFDGPDTAYRDRTIWQVQLVSRDDLALLGYSNDELTCPALANGLNPVTGKRAMGAMRARAELSDLSAGPCTLPPAAGYRSLDNLLYRVEIHHGDDEAGATYKWSRENAIHRTRYGEIDAGVLVVESVGRDDTTALKSGEWIEIRDQEMIYAEAPGFFAKIDEVIGQRVSIAELLDPVTGVPLLSNSLPDTDKLPAQGFVTRWEGGKPVMVDDATGGWVNLENGVQVRFGDGHYVTGDYWTIPARAVTGDVEWPRNPATGAPLDQPAEGPRRDYAALAWLSHDGNGTWVVEEECRALFPPLTQSKQVLYAGGDGQEALPDPLNPGNLVPVPKALSIAVVRGHKPLAGERIRFRVLEGNGRFANGQTTQIATTDAGGIAAVRWDVDSTTQVQRAFAQRLDAADNPTHAPIAFNASLSTASHVSFDPANTPELGPANTVQKAIEAILGLQQVGCTTYIIQEGEDWVARLEGLDPEENASICFARGIYKTSRTVKLKGTGHLKIGGAGPGTVQIIANRSEAALAFEGFASVSVSCLEFNTPDGNAAIDSSVAGHRQGTLDFGHCASVDVHGCTLKCGGGTSPKRTCISVRGWSDTLDALRVSQSVRITDNTLSVGHLQDGIVVSDALDVEISGNHLAAKSGKGGLKVDAFLKDKAWVAKSSKDLVARPVKGSLALGKGAKEIAAKQWRMSFNSPVPQEEWDALVKTNSPTDAQLKSEATFTKYANELVSKAVESPDVMPSFRKQMDRVAGSFGNGSAAVNDKKFRQTLLLASEPMVHRFDAKAGKGREVLVEANGHVVSFDSPIDQKDWNRMIARSKAAPNVANAGELLALTETLARDVLKDKEARAGLGSVDNWLKAKSQDGVSYGKRGIVCGGRKLQNVTVRGNVIRSFEMGVKVAVSHKRQKDLRTRTVSIDDNRMELITESDLSLGMMVGNIHTLRIRGNEMLLSDRPNKRRFLSQGIRIWGYLGEQILVAENRIEAATMGIRLNAVNSISDNDQPLWVIRENLIRGPSSTRNWKLNPSWAVETVNNRVLKDL